MEVRAVFCSACDRDVPVLMKKDAPDPHAAGVQHPDDAMMCLDYGVRCTGCMCPLFDLPVVPLPESRAVARERRAREKRTRERPEGERRA